MKQMGVMNAYIGWGCVSFPSDGKKAEGFNEIMLPAILTHYGADFFERVRVIMFRNYGRMMATHHHYPRVRSAADAIRRYEAEYDCVLSRDDKRAVFYGFLAGKVLPHIVFDEQAVLSASVP